MIAHLLSSVPCVDVRQAPLSLPHRPPPKGYECTPGEMQTYVPDHVGTLDAGGGAPTKGAPSKGALKRAADWPPRRTAQPSGGRG
jgi:hypothetical protein